VHILHHFNKIQIPTQNTRSKSGERIISLVGISTDLTNTPKEKGELFPTVSVPEKSILGELRELPVSPSALLREKGEKICTTISVPFANISKDSQGTDMPSSIPYEQEAKTEHKAEVKTHTMISTPSRNVPSNLQDLELRTHILQPEVAHQLVDEYEEAASIYERKWEGDQNTINLSENCYLDLSSTFENLTTRKNMPRANIDPNDRSWDFLGFHPDWLLDHLQMDIKSRS